MQTPEAWIFQSIGQCPERNRVTMQDQTIQIRAAAPAKLLAKLINEVT